MNRPVFGRRLIARSCAAVGLPSHHKREQNQDAVAQYLQSADILSGQEALNRTPEGVLGLPAQRREDHDAGRRQHEIQENKAGRKRCRPRDIRYDQFQECIDDYQENNRPDQRAPHKFLLTELVRRLTERTQPLSPVRQAPAPARRVRTD